MRDDYQGWDYDFSQPKLIHTKTDRECQNIIFSLIPNALVFRPKQDVLQGCCNISHLPTISLREFLE